ncbi:MAG: ATP-binding protein, partial [Bryobacteraceae bacterium]
EADAATREGDRKRELIAPEDIMGDEIGQIMKSRNATVDELRRHEDDRAVALRKLEEQDRLVSLGMLSASVAHEMNTPLAVLHGSIEKLEETLADPQGAHSPQTLVRLARMKRVTERLRLISASLLDFARPKKDVFAPTRLRPVVEEAWNLVAIDEKAASIQFVNEVAEDAQVMGNADRLVQVFVNLLRNALIAVESAGTDAGRIEVRSRRIERNREAIEAVTVEDNGRGIPADVLPDIFDAFVSTRLDAKGTGLGLTVAEGIVTQHGGTISAGNRAEGGARLEVCLPGA